ncbi:MAG TPA: hypothetical protein DEQ02_00615 [Ruminococcaceae bacterium]|nr:hypothetical protein [Oscillospiraceae bacterium]
MKDNNVRDKKRHAPSVRGNPAVRPNSPVQSDESYRAPTGVKNINKEYELLSQKETAPKPGEFYF